MRAANFEGDIHVKGSVFATTTIPLPAGTVTDAMVNGSADIAATKLEHQHSLTYSQPSASAVVAETSGIFTCRGLTGTIVQFEAAIIGTIATGADRTVTVDLQKSTGA